jgi:hypothetical protein
MNPVVHALVLFGILALFLFGPRRGGRPLSSGERLFGLTLITLLAMAYGLALLWSFVIGDRLPLSVG